MNNCYTKLFHSILQSSIWDNDSDTKVVWITLLAMVDREGIVIGTPKSIARWSGVDVEKCRQALEQFCEPDPDGLDQPHEGRRLERVVKGYRLLNHEKYRDLMSAGERREYYRRKKREARAKMRDLNKGLSTKEMLDDIHDAG